LNLILVVAVLGSLVPDRQERRHRFEKRQEYEGLGWDIPLERPKLSIIESWANVGRGVLLFVLGALFLKAMLGIPAEMMRGGWESLVALFLASGLALVWLGLKAVRQNITYKPYRLNRSPLCLPRGGPLRVSKRRGLSRGHRGWKGSVELHK